MFGRERIHTRGGRLKERRLLLLAINDIGFFVAVCHGLHK